MVCKYLLYIFAYGFSFLGSQIAIKRILNNMWNHVKKGVEENTEENTNETVNIRPLPWIPDAIGLLETALYVSACFIKKYEFIAAWLALKAVGTITNWSNNEDVKRYYGRAVYNIFLIGNGLKVLYSFVGVSISMWLIEVIEGKNKCENILNSILAGIGVILLSIILFLWSKQDKAIKK